MGSRAGRDRLVLRLMFWGTSHIWLVAAMPNQDADGPVVSSYVELVAINRAALLILQELTRSTATPGWDARTDFYLLDREINRLQDRLSRVRS